MESGHILERRHINTEWLNNVHLKDNSVFKTAEFNNQARERILQPLALLLLNSVHSTEGKTVQPIHMLYLPSLVLVYKPLQPLYLASLILRNLQALIEHKN
jgi:hypothetical protein